MPTRKHKIVSPPTVVLVFVNDANFLDIRGSSFELERTSHTLTFNDSKRIMDDIFRVVF